LAIVANYTPKQRPRQITKPLCAIGGTPNYMLVQLRRRQASPSSRKALLFADRRSSALRGADDIKYSGEIRQAAVQIAKLASLSLMNRLQGCCRAQEQLASRRGWCLQIKHYRIQVPERRSVEVFFTERKCELQALEREIDCRNQRELG